MKTTKITTEDSPTTEGSPKAPAEVVDSDVVVVGSEDGGGQRLRRRRPYHRGRGQPAGPPTFVAVTDDGCCRHQRRGGVHSAPGDASGTADDDQSTTSPCDGRVEGGGGGTVYATDPSVFPIPGMFLRDDFLTAEEEERVLRILDGDCDDCGVTVGDKDDDVDDELGGEGRRPPRWRNTGFSSTDSRRRQIHVRREPDGGCGDVEVAPRASPFESRWGWLLDRLLMTPPCPSAPSSPTDGPSPPPPSSLLSTPGCPCGHPEDDTERSRTLRRRRRWRYVDRVEMVAEEYRGASRPSPSVLEDRRPLNGDQSSRRCHRSHHRCRVALVVELSLGNHAVLSLQKPRVRSDDEWSLLARTKILVKRRSALVRRGEFLEDWRSHVSCRGQHPAVRGTDDGGRGGRGADGATGGIELPDGMGRLVRDGSYRRVGLKIRFFESVDDCSCASANCACGGEAGEVIESKNSSLTAATCVDGGGNGGGKASRCDGGAFPGDAPANVSSPSTSTPSSSSPSPTTSSPPPPPPLPLPLRELLTVVVTTSPIKSNPSTELLEKTFSTFHLAGRDFARTCRKVIVCDGLRLLDDEDEDEDGGGAEVEEGGKKEGERGEAADRTRRSHRRVSRKYTNAKQSLRNGIATREQAERYEGFKEALRQLCARAEAEDEDDAENLAAAPDGVDDGGGGGKNHPSPNSTTLSAFRNTVVVELAERHGYGFALREALRHHVTTPYVCVVQHDRTFMRPTPVEEVVRAMMIGSGCGGGVRIGNASASAKIRYVGMSMRSNLLYRDIFLTKYGKAAHREMDSMVLRPRELRLSSAVYGRDGSGPRDMMTSSISSRKLRENLRSLSETYFASETYSCHRKWVDERHADGSGGCGDDRHDDDLAQLTLTPTLFWYDNTHVAETAHYRDYVFNPRYRNVARGGFVEDKLSPVLLRQVERLGLREAHSNFGCYLLDDHSGTFFTGHLDGGSYVTEGERGAIIAAMAASCGGIGGSS